VQGVFRAYDGLVNAMRVLAGIVIFVVFVLIVSDVLIRLAGFQPWIYSLIVVEYSLLWFAMLAAPYLVRAKGHVFIDAVTAMLSADARRIVEKIAYIICICSSVVFAWYSGALLVEAITDNLIDVRAEEIPLWLLLAPMPWCFVLVTVEFLRYLIGVDSMYGERTDVRDNV
jgi:TRAP-type C4-dicarboxylate transport system permease small subunit